jgi:hypothetical protein
MPSPTNAPDLEWARAIAAAAGLDLSSERLLVFAAALQRNSEQTRMLLAVDYGRAEPASRFSAPRPAE